MAQDFEFKQIFNLVSLEEATASLVHTAQCIQRTHDNASATKDKQTMQHLFDLRKASVTVLLDAIQQYINQMPDTSERKNDELEIPSS